MDEVGKVRLQIEGVAAAGRDRACTVPTCLSVAWRAAKPMPDLRCVPSQKASPPIESAGVTL